MKALNRRREQGITPAATPESLALIGEQLGIFDPCAIACESFRQWVIEDHFVQGRPDWNRVGAGLLQQGARRTIEALEDAENCIIQG